MMDERHECNADRSFEGEGRYNALFNAIDEGFCVIEMIFDEARNPVDYRFLETNTAFEDQTGLIDAVGRSIGSFAPAHEKHWFEIYGRVARDRQPERFENTAAYLGHFYDIYAFPIDAPQLNRVGVLFRDVAEQKRQEGTLHQRGDEHDFLLKFTDALRPLVDADEIQGIACRLLGEYLGANRAYYLEYKSEEGSGTVARDYVRDASSSLAGRYDHDTYRTVYEHGKAGGTWIVTDVEGNHEIAPSERQLLAAQEVIAWIDVPLVKNGELVAILCVVHGEPRKWTTSEVAIVEDVAERTWATVERARAETALRESEVKYRSLFETMGQGYCDLELIRDADGRAIDQRYIELNPAFERLFGISVAEAKGRTASEVFPGLDQGWHDTFDRIAKHGKPERIEYQVTSLDRWFEVFVYPRGGDHLTVLYEDFTERRHAEDALRESEERLRQFGEASSDVLWIRNAATLQWEYLTLAFEPIYGIGRVRALTGDNLSNWIDLVHQEDRDHVLAAIDRVRAGERQTFEYRIRRPSDGAVRWLRDTDFPLFDGAGRVAHIGGIGHDVTPLKGAEERQRLLLAELQHRVRNTLAVIRSIARRTALTSASMEDYIMHLEGRIDAFARIQTTVTRDPAIGVDLATLISDELHAAQAEEGDRVRLSGPEVQLRPKAAETLALAMHELATNAIKYGALSTNEGRIEVTWTTEKGPAPPVLHIRWEESGLGGLPSQPARHGFGTELLEKSLAYDLKARTRLAYAPTGLACQIVMPLDRVSANMLEDV